MELKRKGAARRRRSALASSRPAVLLRTELKEVAIKGVADWGPSEGPSENCAVLSSLQSQQVNKLKSGSGCFGKSSWLSTCTAQSVRSSLGRSGPGSASAPPGLL